MELADEITIPAPRDRVFAALNDVAIRIATSLSAAKTRSRGAGMVISSASSILGVSF